MPRKFEVELFTFDELSKKAKERAVKDFGDDPENTWDDDDAHMLTELFETDLKDHYGLGNLKAWWSLGYCQGDGVCFEGSVDIPGFIKAEKQEKRFQKIIGLAEEGLLFITIKNRGRSCHYNSMEIEVDFRGDDESSGPRDWSPRGGQSVSDFEEYLKDRVEEISQEMEKAGYKEIEYHRSNEYIEEILENRDWEYTKSGERWEG